MNANSFSIRIAKENDLNKVMEIVKLCTQNLINKKIFQWNDNYPNLNIFKEDILKENLYVLIDKNENIIGCVSISYEMDDFYKKINWISQNKNNLYVHRLAIHPYFQNQGNGKRIMKFIEKKAILEKCYSIRLDTFSINKQNNEFYKKIGFCKLGEIFFPNQSEFPFNCYEKPLEKFHN